jgi:hypothetical protein
VGGRPRGDDWAVCATHREAIRRWLDGHIRLTKIRKLLAIRAQSAVDRFTSNAYDLVIEGDSYRPRFKPHLTTAAAKPSGKERSR